MSGNWFQAKRIQFNAYFYTILYIFIRNKLGKMVRSIEAFINNHNMSVFIYIFDYFFIILAYNNNSLLKEWARELFRLIINILINWYGNIYKAVILRCTVYYYSNDNYIDKFHFYIEQDNESILIYNTYFWSSESVILWWTVSAGNY